MNKTETGYELRPEYDVTSLQITKLGSKHKSFGDLIRLDPDVALAFPNSEAVNEALRYLIDLAKRPNLLS
ncbi:conserved hypothetical protein [Crenothrix polyspora]|jgi:hypothetical protein|uniref:Uncharacterized protein n=1 Tax=Crenothrix polyspora TaxID=360316 RepID=A0A1R4HHN2_9GAMM|nr:hypothetical protein [Crenothrix polyspora]SJM95758.1 conserved hypothetical protein [Crenothrix polyspora]